MKTILDKLSSEELQKLSDKFRKETPFNYVVIDNFLSEEDALALSREFPSYDNEFWYSYDNPLEIKKASNNWNMFETKTYQFFTHVLSDSFTQKVEILLYGESDNKLKGDIGLHGGGFHTHKSGGKLNPHLDYSIHPKLGLQRTINLILYINPEWRPEYGGALGLWEHNSETGKPGKLVKKVDCVFNRAILFNTTQNSWHGICNEITAPGNLTRNSLATYYLAEPTKNYDTRVKVKYAATEDQQNDPEIEKLIEARQSSENFSKVYIKK